MSGWVLLTPITAEAVELHDSQHHDSDGFPRALEESDIAQCGACFRAWCDTCHPAPSARCPFECEHEEEEEDRPTVVEEAERLLGYWEQHGHDPEVVSRWAVQDLLGFLRFIVEEQA